MQVSLAMISVHVTFILTQAAAELTPCLRKANNLPKWDHKWLIIMVSRLSCGWMGRCRVAPLAAPASGRWGWSGGRRGTSSCSPSTHAPYLNHIQPVMIWSYDEIDSSTSPNRTSKILPELKAGTVRTSSPTPSGSRSRFYLKQISYFAPISPILSFSKYTKISKQPSPK